MTPAEVRNRNLCIAVALVLYLAVSLVGAGGLLPSRGLDATSVASLADTGRFSRAEGGYRTTALLYSHTSPFLRRALTFVIGASAIVFCYFRLSKLHALAAMSFLIISPIVFIYSQFIKDLFLVPFVLLCSFVLRTRMPALVKIGLVLCVYLGYAVLFRSYYFLIAAIFAALCAARRLPIWGSVLLAALALTCLAYAPESFFVQLQGPRDIANIERVGRDVVGARTAFMNLRTPDSYGDFLLNYAYAASRLFLPFLYSIRLQEMFLFANTIMYGVLVTFGMFIVRLLRGVPGLAPMLSFPAQMGAILTLSHVVVLVCFEPDLGSFLRHLSSTLPYISLVLSAVQLRPVILPGMFRRRRET